MTTITIRLASAERFADVEHALTGGGDGASCWCQWFMVRQSEFDAATSDERRDMLRRDLATEPLPSALIAYVDDEPAGWVKVSPRPAQPRLARGRTAKASAEPSDAPDVWAVTCFAVRREYRSQQLARRLLDAAVDHARAHGARIVEGYPIDTATKTTTSNDLFHGALSTFTAAGFTETARTSPHRPIVALTLA